MKKIISIVLTINLLLGIFVLYPCTASATTKVYNNVTSATYGNYIFYRNSDNNGIYRMTKAGKNEKKIANSSTSFFVHKSRLYYYDNDNQMYSVKFNGKGKKKLSVPENSNIACFYGGYVVYSVGQHLYKMNLSSGKTTYLYDCGDYSKFILRGNFLFIDTSGLNSINLCCYNLKNNKATKLINKTVSSEYYSADYYSIDNILISGKSVYFTVGYIQGSGHFYNGCFYKVGSNGKNLKKLVSKCGPDFYIKGNTIYLDEDYDGYSLDYGCIKLSTSGKVIKKYNGKYTVHGCNSKYIFFTKKNSNHLYYGKSLSSKKVAVKGKAKHANFYLDITTQGKYLFVKSGINTYINAMDNVSMLAKTFRFVKKKL